jgi:hypothetical protein
MAEKKVPQRKSYDELRKDFLNPFDRLYQIADTISKLAADVEAGKELNPRKIKRLSGSLCYWSEKILWAGLLGLNHPGAVMAARLEKLAEDRSAPAHKH